MVACCRPLVHVVEKLCRARGVTWAAPAGAFIDPALGRSRECRPGSQGASPVEATVSHTMALLGTHQRGHLSSAASGPSPAVALRRLSPGDQEPDFTWSRRGACSIVPQVQGGERAGGQGRALEVYEAVLRLLVAAAGAAAAGTGVCAVQPGSRAASYRWRDPLCRDVRSKLVLGGRVAAGATCLNNASRSRHQPVLGAKTATGLR